FVVLDTSTTEQRERVFAGGEPVDHLLVVAADRDVHFAEEPLQEFRAKLGMVVIEAQVLLRGAGTPRIRGDDLPAPSRANEVPIGGHLFRTDQRRVVRNPAALSAALVNEN